MKNNSEQKNKKGGTGINPYILLGCFVLAAALLTHFIPAGSFERTMIEGVSRPVVVPGTYQAVASNPTSISTLLGSVNQGLVDAGMIIFLVFASTGTFAIFQATGAFNNGIGVMLKKLDKSKIPDAMVLLLMVFLFSFLGYVSGPDGLIPFTLVACMISVGLGYDLAVGLALILAGSGVGFSMSAINAAVVGTPQSILGLPIFSGAGFRTIMWLVETIVVGTVIILYGNRVKKNREKSICNGIDTKGLALEGELDNFKIDRSQGLVLVIFLFMCIMMVVGSLKFGWYLNEIGGLNIVCGIAAGLVARKKLKETIDIFVKGAATTAGVALLIGLARAIQVIFENASVLDTIIQSLSGPLSTLSPSVAAVFISVITAIIHIFITSGSGLSVAMMPILGPLGQIVGLTAQTTVLAFQIGGSALNMITPTLGSTMAMCGMSRVPFSKWFKFGLQIAIPVLLVAWIFILVAVKIGF